MLQSLLESWLLKPVVRQKDSSDSTWQKVAIWVKCQMRVLSAMSLQFDANFVNYQQKLLGKVPKQTFSMKHQTVILAKRSGMIQT